MGLHEAGDSFYLKVNSVHGMGMGVSPTDFGEPAGQIRSPRL